MLSHRKIQITPEEYLAYERKAEIRSEYMNGEIFAMAGASRNHNRILSNLVRVLGNQLIDKPCSAYSSEMKVKIGKANKYAYPDIVVACDKEEFEDGNEDILLNPIVIIEVLSDSTEAYDRGLKFFHYQFIDSLREYILISQKLYRIEIFRRQNNSWLYLEIHSINDSLEIGSIECQLAMKDVYLKLNL